MVGPENILLIAGFRNANPELIMYSRISHNIQAKLECTYASINVLPYTNELDVAAMRIKFNLNHSVDPVKIEVADPVATGLGLL